MKLFYNNEANPEDLLALNHCRLFLHAYYASDRPDGSGQVITDYSWMGYHFQHIHTWPQQAN